MFTISSPKHDSNDLDCQHLNELDGNGRLPDPAAPHHHDLVLVLVHPLLLDHLLGPSSWPPPSSPPRAPPRSPPWPPALLWGAALPPGLLLLTTACQTKVKSWAQQQQSSRVRAAAATWAAELSSFWGNCERHLYFTHTTHGQGCPILSERPSALLGKVPISEHCFAGTSLCCSHKLPCYSPDKNCSGQVFQYLSRLFTCAKEHFQRI